jgi:hypothetical protein
MLLSITVMEIQIFTSLMDQLLLLTEEKVFGLQLMKLELKELES